MKCNITVVPLIYHSRPTTVWALKFILILCYILFGNYVSKSDFILSHPNKNYSLKLTFKISKPNTHYYFLILISPKTILST